MIILEARLVVRSHHLIVIACVSTDWGVVGLALIVIYGLIILQGFVLVVVWHLATHELLRSRVYTVEDNSVHEVFLMGHSFGLTT
jgi:hypothetical protein